MASEKLSDHLKSLILQPNIQHSPSSLRPLIEVVCSEGDKAEERSGVSSNPDENYCPDDGDNCDDDGGPPPIIFPTKPTATQTPSSSSKFDNQCNSGTSSLAEQLLAEATLAKEKQRRVQEQKDRQRAKKSNFGLKKGFLNSSSSKRENSIVNDGVCKDESHSKKNSDKKYQGDAAVEQQKRDRQVS